MFGNGKAIRAGWINGPARRPHAPELNAITSTVLLTGFAAVVLLVPGMAFAADVPSAVSDIIDLIGKALQVFGAGLGIWGVVKVGLAVNNPGQSGNDLSEGIGRIAGGVLIFAAATAFDNLLDGFN